MFTTLKTERLRYAFLAVLFVVAFSFQLTICAETFAGFWSQRQQLGTGLIAHWALLFILHVLTPLACLLLGFYVASVRIWDRQAWLLFAVLLSFSIVSNGTDVHDKVMLWTTPLRHLALAYRTCGFLSWPFWIMVFAIYFPERAEFDRRHPWLKWTILVPVLAIYLLAAVIRITSNEGVVYAPFQSMASIISIPRTFVLWISIVFFLIVLLLKWFTAQDPDDRRRLRVLFFGLGISLLPPVLVQAITVNILKMRDDDLPAWIAVPAFSLLAFFPVTLAYVTVVQRALDVRVILRQSLQYALARRGVVLLQTLVSLLVILVTATFSGQMSFPERVLITTLGVGAVLFIGFGARRLGNWIDRRFFRDAYDAEQILTRLADQVSSIIELGPLLETVASRTAEALHISEIAVFVSEGNLYRSAFTLGYPQAPQLSFSNETVTVGELRRGKQPLPLYRDDPRSWAARANVSESAMLNELKTQLLLPVARKEELFGFLSLGSKFSEAPYSATDIRLLQSVASQTALAVENSHLTSAIASETAEREIIRRELAIARDVQQRLFPQTYPKIPGVEYCGTCRPAKEVGGDYYDFLELPRHALGIAIGDVAGKGIPASLLMASLQASLRGQTISGPTNIAQLVANINSVIYATSPANRYATFFYGQYEPGLKRLTYVNAGHNAPMLLRQNGKNTEVIRLQAGGAPVGLFPQGSYESSQVDLQNNDLLILFTDGISEAMNTADEEWGEDRLLEALKKSNGAAPDKIVETLFGAADQFTGNAPQHDDMTIVILRFQSGC